MQLRGHNVAGMETKVHGNAIVAPAFKEWQAPPCPGGVLI
jgi:hypothetical protein